VAFFDWLRERTRDAILAGSYEASEVFDRPGQAEQDAKAAAAVCNRVGVAAEPHVIQGRLAKREKQRLTPPPLGSQPRATSQSFASQPRIASEPSTAPSHGAPSKPSTISPVDAPPVESSTKGKSQRALEAGLDADLRP